MAYPTPRKAAKRKKASLSATPESKLIAKSPYAANALPARSLAMSPAKSMLLARGLTSRGGRRAVVNVPKPVARGDKSVKKYDRKDGGGGGIGGGGQSRTKSP